MKKTLKLFLAALLVVAATSCNNVLDKKINKDSFLHDIYQIKQENGDKYSTDDFAALALGIGMGNVLGIQNLDGTYRQALENIKVEREKAKADSILKVQKYQKELKVFKDKVAALTRDISLTVLGKGSQPVNDYDESFVFAYSVSNSASQPVTAFAGQVIITDLLGNTLTPINVTYENTIDAGKTIQYKETYDYNNLDSDQATLMNAPFEKLHFSWQPSKVVFQDGTSVTAPEKPEDSPE